MKILKYMIFLVAVLSFMVFFGHKETLSPEESLAITEFEDLTAQNSTTPVAAADPTPGAGSTTSAGSQPQTSPATDTTPLYLKTTPNGTVLEDSVNVRSGPGLDFPVVTQLYKGDQVILGNNFNGWYELNLDGRKYYISADFVLMAPVQ